MYVVPLQAYELYSRALQNCEGRFYEDVVYEIDEVESIEFDKNFHEKEKQSELPSQKRFSELVGMREPRE